MSDIEIHLSQRLSDDDYHKITVAMSLAYRQGRADAIEQMNILGLVNFKTSENPVTRKATIEIDYDDRLNAEQVVAIILEQLKEKNNDRK